MRYSRFQQNSALQKIYCLTDKDLFFASKTPNWASIPYFICCVLFMSNNFRRSETLQIRHQFAERNEMLLFDSLVLCIISVGDTDPSRQCRMKIKCFTIQTIIIIALKGVIRDCLQFPHCAANCLQHVHSRGPGAIVCKSGV